MGGRRGLTALAGLLHGMGWVGDTVIFLWAGPWRLGYRGLYKKTRSNSTIR